MSSVDEDFIRDLDQCLQVAGQLGDVDSEDVRLFVSQQLQELHKFVQKKHNDAEKRLEEEIKKEEIEIDNLRKRIDRATESDGIDESDIAYTDFNTLWVELKDRYWQIAFNAYISETDDTVKVIFDNLIAILKTSFRHCKEKAAASREKIMFQVYFPGEDIQKNKSLKIPKPLEPSLVSTCKKCQMKSTPFCLPSIHQAVIGDVKKDKSVKERFNYRSNKTMKEAIETYVEKCVDFSWIACLEEPEVRLITSPKQECNSISSQFIGLDKTVYKNRSGCACVEWPAVIQGEAIRIPWQLYTLDQPRPQPKHIHADRSKDNRISRIEGGDGELHSDTEDDDVTHANVQTATETVSSGDSTSQAKTKENSTRTQGKPTDVNGQKDSNVSAKVGGVKSEEKRKPGGNKQAKPAPYQDKRMSEGHPNTQF